LAGRHFATMVTYVLATQLGVPFCDAQPAVSEFINRLDVAYKTRSAFTYQAMFDCPLAEIQPFLAKGADDALANYHGKILGRTATVLYHPDYGVLVDYTDPIQRRVRRGVDLAIYAGDSIATISGEPHETASRQQVGSSLLVASMSAGVAPFNLAADVAWRASQDPQATIGEAENAEIAMTLENLGRKYRFVFDEHDLTLLRREEESKTLQVKVEYSGFIRTDAMTARFPRIAQSTVVRKSSSAAAPFQTVTVYAVPEKQESANSADFKWSTFARNVRDSTTGIVYGADEKPIENQPPPVKESTETAGMLDPKAVERHKTDPSVLLLPVERSRWARGLLALGISCLLVAAVWLYRNRSSG